ncbi:ABC transporter ATP-binding protein [Arthrobacter bambusae]|uniref:ABC-2 type transport system ATP-binding protein n=1 Tax=Arthrobacter bambusae TaxID=1338426 RepID=A0AAW8DFN4_9MICC|nr:ABC transporter ATP-binding protein [Arthrobacter bambusae]MDP9905353.1 ABC-2 type transport system ATP-binding protein [Arthrobacter bambusae]MDQ0129169.1 ABC-2 type transport system ATP-binding protein [Arthrobacter bambusae]MDQ0180485.1 ABC-2 type transport system ATP-binding protein [Arthrobacter bambusae]
MTTASVPAVQAAGLHKSFGKVHAVRGLDLTVQPGEVVAFLGPNGAGKTTTIDMILGLSAPDQGSVSIFGHTPRGAIARGQVAAVMQTGGLLRDISVRETVQLNAAMFDSSRPVDEVLARAGILEIADRKVEKCSGGQQQRLRFAMALVSDPGLLILDEPTTGMDVAGRRDFWTAIRSDAQRGRTVIFATHYLEEADAYADRIVLVRQGSIVADGTAAQIKNLASGRTVKASLPAAERGLLAGMPPVESMDYDGGRLTVRTGDSDAVVRFLLNNTGAHDVEVAANNLEEAFVALTGDDAAPESTSITFGDLV